MSDVPESVVQLFLAPVDDDPSGLDARWDVIVPALPKQNVDGSPLMVAPAPFRLFLELRLGEVVPSWTLDVADLQERALPDGFRIDRQRTIVLAGVEHVIVPGDGGTRALGLVHRRSDLSAEEFLRHWSKRHVHYARRMPGRRGYRQLRADRSLTRASAEHLGLVDAGFEGAGQVFFDDADQMRAGRAAPEVARDSVEDELRFIDHSRSHFFAAQLRSA